MSDLDGYTKLLAQESKKHESRRLQFAQQQASSGSEFKDAIMCERALIASRLLVHYESGKLTVEDIARATGVSMSRMFDLIKANKEE